ncbi:MAG: DUF1926 domain-containing protein [Deltaproteobacteria bacterium]|nr:DUF1926 domain-containing protein [Deltaproteobacteria bacterium]
MTYLALCIHNHQPVGNFDFVLEEAYRKSYWPFLRALSGHPSIKLTLHNSGFLLDWLIERKPEYVELLKAMVERGQVEIMGGGYYEPVLAVIPEQDRIGQIRRMSERIHDVFGAAPSGIWLAERVWEPTMPTTIRKAGVEYLLVDDFHFIKSGLSRDLLGGYYVTEDQGNMVRVFPGSERLRYLIPFKPADELTAHLKSLGFFLKRGNCAIYGDDGEKFGVWPGTDKWVFDDGWLESFFAKIESSLDWLQPVTFAEYISLEEPLGRVYLPTTSYMEMGEWSLPADTARSYAELIEELKRCGDDAQRVFRFLQGGQWRNFFAKYPESNWLHKRMLLASKAVDAARAGAGKTEGTNHLYKAQSNDPYWHGVFGGLYLPHLRTSAYENIIKAENAVDDSAATSISVEDVDADGHDEVMIRTRDINLFISPRNGGTLVEMDFKPSAVNFSNTLSRWLEGYHHKLTRAAGGAHDGGGSKSIHDMLIAKEAGLEALLKFDALRRSSFVDRLLDARTSFDDFSANAYKDSVSLADLNYSVTLDDKGVTLARQGQDAYVQKRFGVLDDNSFTVDYSAVIGGKARAAGIRFCVEFNLILPCCDGPACWYEFSPAALAETEASAALNGKGALSGLNRVDLIDAFTGVMLTIESRVPATLWRFPVYTVSLSESGFEKIYQGSCLAFLFDPASNGEVLEFNNSFKVTARKYV